MLAALLVGSNSAVDQHRCLASTNRTLTGPGFLGRHFANGQILESINLNRGHAVGAFRILLDKDKKLRARRVEPDSLNLGESGDVPCSQCTGDAFLKYPLGVPVEPCPCSQYTVHCS